MLNKIVLIFAFCILSFQIIFAQSTSYTSNPKFENEISSYLSYSVPLISVHDLKNIEEDVIILDAREIEEYDLSRIPNAQFIGFNNPDFSNIDDFDKDVQIIIYCSIGYRSEKIGEKLQESGFENVYNLYGSIFEWANAGFELESAEGKPTNKLHTYDKNWSKWVINPEIEKVW